MAETSISLPAASPPETLPQYPWKRYARHFFWNPTSQQLCVSTGSLKMLHQGHVCESFASQACHLFKHTRSEGPTPLFNLNTMKKDPVLPVYLHSIFKGCFYGYFNDLFHVIYEKQEIGIVTNFSLSLTYVSPFKWSILVKCICSRWL